MSEQELNASEGAETETGVDSAEVVKNAENAENAENVEAKVEPELTPEQIIEEALKKAGGLRHKVGDEEIAFDSLAELRKNIGLNSASTKKYQEAAELKKQADAILESAKGGNVIDVLKQVGIEEGQISSLLADHLEKVLEEQNIDPKEKELREYKRKVEEQERKEQEAKDKADQEKEMAALKQIQDEIIDDVSVALEASALPKDAFLINRVLAEMSSAAQHDYPMSAADAVATVQADVLREYSRLLKGLPVEHARKLLGDELLDSFVEAKVKDVKQAAAETLTKPSKTKAVNQSKAKKEPESPNKPLYDGKTYSPFS